jgi:hypothetical protein
MVMLSWLLNEEPLSSVDELAITVLDELLMGTRTSVLYKAMAESGLGAAVVGGGVSDELKQATFAVGLKGVKAEDVAKAEELAMATLRQAAEEGFEEDAVEVCKNGGRRDVARGGGEGAFRRWDGDLRVTRDSEEGAVDGGSLTPTTLPSPARPLLLPQPHLPSSLPFLL